MSPHRRGIARIVLESAARRLARSRNRVPAIGGLIPLTAALRGEGGHGEN